MENEALYTVILSPDFAAPNFTWLQSFAFYNDSNGLYFFACRSYEILPSGLVEFQALLKNAVEQISVLLPSHSIAGILGGDFRKNQLGFLGQRDSHE